MDRWIESPEDPRLPLLCDELAARAEGADDQWPGDALELCAQHGVYRWFVPVDLGGLEWSEADLLRGYLRLSAASLTTTFILTQATGAIRRLTAVGNEPIRQEWLPSLLNGARFATLGISHLTTSRRHLGQPALTAASVSPEDDESDFILSGQSPWVTGGVHADLIVTGAEMPDGKQLLAALPTELKGVECDPPARLVGLTGSHTGAVRLSNVRLQRRWVLDGPRPDVMQGATGAKTGGLQTSALAIGLSGRAIEWIEEQVGRRSELTGPAEGLRREHGQLHADLLALAEGRASCAAEELRARANSLVLRSTQAALAAAKGTGYVAGHPAGRWCREALFFLVWSCPTPVMAANLCELAGIAE